MNPHTKFWDTGVHDVPRMTGTTPGVRSCPEVRDICARLKICLPFDRLFDVGCGTGRFTQLAGESYVGVDISPSAVTYCQQRGIPATLIDGPMSLTAWPANCADWVVAWSVFTHIDRAEQQAYLAQFIRLAPQVLVDILPDDRGRGPGRWGTDEAGFRDDLIAAGYTIDPLTPDLVDQVSSARHRYFRGTR